MWLLGFLSSSIGILFGGSIAWLLKGFQKKIDTIYALCAGMILGILSIELFPEAINLSGWFISIVGFFVGLIIYDILDRLLHNDNLITNNPQKNQYIRTGILLFLSISIHNLPMGIIIGANQGSDISMIVLQTLLLHSIPEGIILFTPFILAGLNLYILIYFPIVISLPVIIGVIIGNLIGLKFPMVWGFIISFTVGIICMVTVKEIFLKSIKESTIMYILFISLMGFCLVAYYIIMLS